MPRRRSSRLASAAKSKATPELSSVTEHDEPNHNEPVEATPVPSSPARVPSTPASSAIKPPYDEMHPSKAHANVAAPSSALRLGFSDIKPDDARRGSLNAPPDATPSRVNKTPSSEFTFRATPRRQSGELSSEAQKLMSELRGQAAEIKADLLARRAAEEESVGPNGRKIIKPKGKAGRYSAAHMAEFKKMDSIEGHASAWRAQPGRQTPNKAGLKRSPSKADLDATPTSAKSALKRSTSKLALDTTPTPTKSSLKKSTSKANLDVVPISPPKRSLKRKSSAAILELQQELAMPTTKIDFPLSPSKIAAPANDGQQPAAKRLKKRLGDDSSNDRPVSRDGSSIPQPASGLLPRSQSTLARLTSPTKASLAHTASAQKPTVSLVVSPPPQPDFGQLKKSATTQSLTSPSKAAELKRRIISPGRFQKVKSILRRSKPEATAIPQPTIQVSQTPGPRGSVKVMAPCPFTTPRRKLVKHVTFNTPDATRATSALAAQDSPTPRASKFRFTQGVDNVQYQSVGEVLARSKGDDDVIYPDLSSLQRRTLGTPDKKSSTPGTFTFRSDHTIELGSASPTGFGASPGQSSVRHVRKSIPSTAQMPGSFPEQQAKILLANKENDPPASEVLIGVPHGMPNKKRRRASTDEEDAEREAAERAAKKRRNENVPDGQTILKSRPIGTTPTGSVKKPSLLRGFSQTPSRTPSKTPLRTPSSVMGSASPTKKRAILSMSRLNMLARPKSRN
jgi:hypothetical protein